MNPCQVNIKSFSSDYARTAWKQVKNKALSTLFLLSFRYHKISWVLQTVTFNACMICFFGSLINIAAVGSGDVDAQEWTIVFKRYCFLHHILF